MEDMGSAQVEEDQLQAFIRRLLAEERQRILAAIDELQKEAQSFNVVHDKDSVASHKRGQMTGALDTIHEIRRIIQDPHRE